MKLIIIVAITLVWIGFFIYLIPGAAPSIQYALEPADRCTQSYKVNSPLNSSFGYRIPPGTGSEVEAGFKDAILYWRGITGLDIHRDDNLATCSLTLEGMEGENEYHNERFWVAGSELSEAWNEEEYNSFTGLIQYSETLQANRYFWRLVFIHEIGHEFQLKHSDNHSIMYWCMFHSDRDVLNYPEEVYVRNIRRPWMLLARPRN